MSLTLTGSGQGSEASTSFQAAVMADNPIAYWRLGEPSGTTAVDQIGAAHNGSYVGTVTLNSAGALTGSSDTAMAVAGAGAFSAAIDLSGRNVLTVEFFLKWTAFANNDAMAIELTVDGGATAGGFYIDPNQSGGAFQVSMKTAASQGTQNFNRPSAGVYHHIVLVIDRTVTVLNGAFKLYIDSVLQTATGSVDGSFSGNFANSTLYGMARAGTSLFATGSMDELVLYGTALSQARITAHYAARLTNPNWALAPAGARIKGGNIVPKRGTISDVFNPNSWAELWGLWDWAGWVKPMLDNAKSIGLNTVRVMGSHNVQTGSGGPYGAQISRAAYLANWTQLLDYCRSIGLWVYPSVAGDSQISDYGHSVGSDYGYTPGAAWMLGEYQAIATLFASYTDIIVGIDLYNEAQTWTRTLSNSQPIYNAVKAILPHVSLTWSTAWGAQPTDLSALPAQEVVDHWEVHIYFFEPTSNTLDGVFDGSGTQDIRKVVIGEFGINDLSNSTARQSFYTSIKGLLTHIGANGRQCAGAMAWALSDQDQDASPRTNHYGLWTQGGTPRSDIITVLQTFPTTIP